MRIRTAVAGWVVFLAVWPEVALPCHPWGGPPPGSPPPSAPPPAASPASPAPSPAGGNPGAPSGPAGFGAAGGGYPTGGFGSYSIGPLPAWRPPLEIYHVTERPAGSRAYEISSRDSTPWRTSPDETAAFGSLVVREAWDGRPYTVGAADPEAPHTQAPGGEWSPRRFGLDPAARPGVLFFMCERVKKGTVCDCVLMRGETFTDAAVSALVPSFDWFRIDIDHPGTDDLVRKYGVHRAPTIVVVDPTGYEVLRAHGHQRPEWLAPRLQEALEGWPARRERYEARLAGYERRMALAVQAYRSNRRESAAAILQSLRASARRNGCEPWAQEAAWGLQAVLASGPLRVASGASGIPWDPAAAGTAPGAFVSVADKWRQIRSAALDIAAGDLVLEDAADVHLFREPLFPFLGRFERYALGGTLATEERRARACEMVVLLLETRDPYVTASVLRFLGRQGGEAYVPVLVDHLDHGLPLIRTAAAEALASVGDPTAAEVLLPTTGDPDATVRQAACEAVRVLAGDTWPVNTTASPDSAARWWEVHREEIRR